MTIDQTHEDKGAPVVRTLHEKPSAESAEHLEHLERLDPSRAQPTGLGLLAEVVTEETDFRWTPAVILNLFAICFVWFVAAWALASGSSALAYIAVTFPADASQVGWVSTAPYVITTVLLVPVGEMSDLIGRKGFVAGLCICGCVGTAISGTASSFATLIGGQCIFGCGAVLAYLPSPLILEMVPRTDRTWIAGIAGATVGLGYIAAPLVMGAFIKTGADQSDSWRGGFYLTSALFGLATIVLMVFYHPGPRPDPFKVSGMRRLLKIDWLGLVLLAAGLAMFLVALSAGGITRPWDSATVIACFVVGGACLIVLVFWAWKCTTEGIFPHCLFVHRNFGLALAIRGVGSFAQIGCQAYLPQLVVRVFTSDGILQAVWNLPFSVGLIVGATGASVGMTLLKDARWIAVFSMCTIALGGGLLVLVKPGVNFAVWFFPAALLGVGIGCEAQIINVVASLCTPDPLIATAVNIGSMSGTLTGAVAITVFGQILQSALKTRYPERVGRAVLEAGLPAADLPALFEAAATQNPAAIQAVPGVTVPVLEALSLASKQAFAASMHNVWYTLMGVALVTAIISTFLASIRDQLTSLVAAPVQQKRSGRLWQNEHGQRENA